MKRRWRRVGSSSWRCGLQIRPVLLRNDYSISFNYSEAEDASLKPQASDAITS